MFLCHHLNSPVQNIQNPVKNALTALGDPQLLKLRLQEWFCFLKSFLQELEVGCC